MREYVSGFISMDLREDAIFTESENKAVGDVSLFYGHFSSGIDFWKAFFYIFFGMFDTQACNSAS